MTKRFDAIEGLRGWLAFAVVLSHLAWMSNFPLFRHLGFRAVLVFLIISGFVVTHLILTRQEPYITYLIQRFARIFPLFFVTCLVGFFATDLLALVDLKDSGLAEEAQGIAASSRRYFWPHALAHAGMIHGVIPNAVLPYSEFAFNAPAWSISLEWQFYITAPIALVVASRTPRLIVALAVIVAVSELIVQKIGYFTFMPGNLLSAAAYLTTGVCSRLIYPQACAFAHHIKTFGVLTVAIVLLPFYDLWPFIIWGMVWIGLVKPGGTLNRAASSVLENPIALYLGSRSYSIYLTHYIVLSIILYAFHRLGASDPNIFVLAAIGIPCIVLVSELTFRGIERPGITFGRRFSGASS